MTTTRDLDGLEVDELMRRGVAAARVGDNDEAEMLLAELVRREPDNADAWLWRAGVARTPQVKREFFERVLQLRPDDADALAGLDSLAKRYGRGVLIDDDDEPAMMCTWHPNRETLLRCNRCGRPMCTECAVQHPVGLRCKECVREMRSPIYVVSLAGYAAAILVALVGGVVAALFMGLVPLSWFFALFIGAGVGTAIAEGVSIAAGRKRGKGLQAAAIAGMLLGVPLAGIALSQSPSGVLYLLQYGNFLGIIVYLAFALGAAATRLR